MHEQLNRAVKLAVDSGEAATINEAYELFGRYSVQIEVGTAIEGDRTLQAALLTAINVATRCLLGGVTVTGAVGVTLALPGRSMTVAEAAEAFGANATQTPGAPRVAIGCPGSSAALHVWCSGWTGGVSPASPPDRGPGTCPLAGVVAGALAISEVFLAHRQARADAGRRPVQLSLWNPGAEVDEGPPLRYLPTNLWLLGLGNLGQAYLWALSMLPYGMAQEGLRLVLQDLDRVSQSGVSTSLLTSSAMVGLRKTRAMASWSDDMGFDARLVERWFTGQTSPQAEEPKVALCGVDNVFARRALSKSGFTYVLEAGLGGGVRDYAAFNLHAFPGTRSSDEIWSPGRDRQPVDTTLSAYRVLASDGLDTCGVSQVAGAAIAVPFVGAVASCFVIAELLRQLNGGPRLDTLEVDLHSPKMITASRSEQAPATIEFVHAVRNSY